MEYDASVREIGGVGHLDMGMRTAGVKHIMVRTNQQFVLSRKLKMRTGEVLRPLGVNTSSLSHQKSFLKETERLWLEVATQNGCQLVLLWGVTLCYQSTWHNIPRDMNPQF